MKGSADMKRLEIHSNPRDGVHSVNEYDEFGNPETWLVKYHYQNNIYLVEKLIDVDDKTYEPGILVIGLNEIIKSNNATGYHVNQKGRWEKSGDTNFEELFLENANELQKKKYHLGFLYTNEIIDLIKKVMPFPEFNGTIHTIYNNCSYDYMEDGLSNTEFYKYKEMEQTLYEYKQTFKNPDIEFTYDLTPVITTFESGHRCVSIKVTFCYTDKYRTTYIEQLYSW